MLDLFTYLLFVFCIRRASFQLPLLVSIALSACIPTVSLALHLCILLECNESQSTSHASRRTTESSVPSALVRNPVLAIHPTAHHKTSLPPASTTATKIPHWHQRKTLLFPEDGTITPLPLLKTASHRSQLWTPHAAHIPKRESVPARLASHIDAESCICMS